MRARIQPIETKITTTDDTSATTTLYRIFVEENLELDHTCSSAARTEPSTPSPTDRRRADRRVAGDRGTGSRELRVESEGCARQMLNRELLTATLNSRLSTLNSRLSTSHAPLRLRLPWRHRRREHGTVAYAETVAAVRRGRDADPHLEGRPGLAPPAGNHRLSVLREQPGRPAERVRTGRRPGGVDVQHAVVWPRPTGFGSWGAASFGWAA